MGAAKRLTAIQRQSIVAQHVLGLSYEDIAGKEKVSTASVQRVIGAYKRDAASRATAELSKELKNYSKQLESNSVETLNSALTRSGNPDYDLYKAAPIAVNVLKGLGLFQGDQAQVGVMVNLAPPASWAASYKLPAQSQACIPQAPVVSASLDTRPADHNILCTSADSDKHNSEDNSADSLKHRANTGDADK